MEEYERSWEQNEELGLNDMDTSSADVAYNAADAGPNVETEVWYGALVSLTEPYV